MGRSSYYFPHDYNARGDEKLIKLRQAEDWSGIGLYWAIVEKLYESNGWLNKDYELLAFDLQTQCERIKKIVEDYDLFIFNQNKFTSRRVLDNLKLLNLKSLKAQKSAKIRWNKEYANALQTQCERNAINKRKEIKENIPTSQSSKMTEMDFNLFWNAYPKHIGKAIAKTKFLKLSKEILNPILQAIELQKSSDQWLKDAGQFIPHPTTWLNRQGWLDELVPQKINDIRYE